MERFFESAEDNFKNKRYTAAGEDYAKPIFLMIDEYLNNKYNITVKDHSERRLFLLSKQKEDKICEELLNIYISVYNLYRETYTRSLSYEEANILRESALKVKDIIENAR
ncbi:hypothetical protein YN1_8410 [Nanoarchaeota archaeon]